MKRNPILYLVGWIRNENKIRCLRWDTHCATILFLHKFEMKPVIFFIFFRQRRFGEHQVCCVWDACLAQRVLLLQHLQGLHGRQGVHPGGNRESRVPKNVICFLYICIQLVYIFVYIHTLHSVEEMLSFTGWRKHHLPRVRQEEDDGGDWGGMRRNIHLKTVFWEEILQRWAFNIAHVEELDLSFVYLWWGTTFVC